MMTLESEVTMSVANSTIATPTFTIQPAAGTMTTQERDLLLDLLVSSQQRLILAIVGLNEHQWTFDPGTDRWSIAQCAEHLALSEDALLGIVRSQILQAAANPSGAAAARGRDRSQRGKSRRTPVIRADVRLLGRRVRRTRNKP